LGSLVSTPGLEKPILPSPAPIAFQALRAFYNLFEDQNERLSKNLKESQALVFLHRMNANADDGIDIIQNNMRNSSESTVSVGHPSNLKPEYADQATNLRRHAALDAEIADRIAPSKGQRHTPLRLLKDLHRMRVKSIDFPLWLRHHCGL
jgi:hypothetical protein